jgi:hypothetical protein
VAGSGWYSVDGLARSGFSSSDGLHIAVRWLDDAAVVKCVGVLSETTREVFDNEMDTCLDRRPGFVRVDLSSVVFEDGARGCVEDLEGRCLELNVQLHLILGSESDVSVHRLGTVPG